MFAQFQEVIICGEYFQYKKVTECKIRIKRIRKWKSFMYITFKARKSSK